MIASVKFPKTGNGYIYEKVQQPVKPNKNYYKYRRGINDFKTDLYESDMKSYEDELVFYNEHKGEFVLPCSKNLVGKEFNFEDKKINVLFGPNACGKTTIIKTITGEFLITDGFSKILEPIEIFGFNEPSEEGIIGYVNEIKKNASVVTTDGSPIYYDNFSETVKNNYNIVGGLGGSVLSSFTDEILYRVGNKKTSMGQHNAFIINKVLSITKNKTSIKSLIEPKYKEILKGNNSTWKKCAKIQYDYFSKFEKFDKDSPITLIFDEVDKSFDIETVWRLYTEVLPNLVTTRECQIIIVSHNPLILSSPIYNNPLYNIVAVDKEYVKEMKEILNGVTF